MRDAIHSTVELGELIRRTRKSLGLRQPDLAGAAGTSVRFIVELEKGKPTAQIGKALEVLRQLGIELVAEDRGSTTTTSSSSS